MCVLSQSILSFLVVCVAVSLPSQGVYVPGGSSTRRRHRNGKQSVRTQSQENRAGGADTDRPTVFERTLVLCTNDNSCEKREFCHGGEGHKSCLPCRKPGRRCHRNGMCCRGNECVDGVCRSKKVSANSRFEPVVDEESIAQDTKANMFRLQEDDRCQSSIECDVGLCCAQHYWSKICKKILVEDDVCTKKRSSIDLFQRCDCGEGLACKRNPNPQLRLHYCQAVKNKETQTTKPTEESKKESPIRIVVGSSKEVYEIDSFSETTTDKNKGHTDVLRDLIVQ